MCMRYVRGIYFDGVASCLGCLIIEQLFIVYELFMLRPEKEPMAIIGHSTLHCVPYL